MMCIENHHSIVFRNSQTLALIFFAFILLIQPVNAKDNRPSTPEPSTPIMVGKTSYGTNQMVVTAHPEATRVGLDILQRGGNAVDAAVAVEMVLGLVEPQSSGIGGGGFVLYYDAKTNKVYSFDGRETAPAMAGKYLFRGENGTPMKFYDAAIGGRAVGVPGTLRMLDMMHKKFGRVVWGDLMTPAITLSNNGFEVTPRLSALVKRDHLKLKNFTDTKLYFFPDAVTPVNAGDVLKNPDYANTLKKIADGGADAFYNGITAETIVKAVNEDFENPGLLSIEDMANYKAVERRAVCALYRGHNICSMGAPSSGGLTLLIALKILEKFDMAKFNEKSPQAWHLISEASRLAFADRNYYMADSDFVKSPGELLLDANYISHRAAQISPDKVNPKITYGTPTGWVEKTAAPEVVYPKPPGTTHISIVDKDGNVVSMTTSIEDVFGSRMYVDGFMLNNQLTDFSFEPEMDGKPVANRVEGGKRPRSTMTPIIVFGPNGKPKLVMGSAGGSAIMGYVLQRIIAVIDWKMDITAALSMPNIVNRGDGIEMESSAEFLKPALQKMGHPVEILDLNSGLTAIEFEHDGRMIGMADPRREGTAAGQ